MLLSGHDAALGGIQGANFHALCDNWCEKVKN